MTELRITPYAREDDGDALLLEEQCFQGSSIQLKFRRPSFQARSEIYDCSKIYCAKIGERLIGIIAGAMKNVRLHGENIKALYAYDLRVHPEFRKKGIGKKLSWALVDDLGKDADCLYTLVNGENEKALGLVCGSFEPKLVYHLTYVIFPVYKRLKDARPGLARSALEIHESYLRHNPGIEFLPSFEEKRLKGYVASLSSEESDSGCSIWTNENLLAEQVVRISFSFRLLRGISAILRPFLKMPSIPRKNEIIRSWFLFDLYAKDKKSLQALMASVNNLALDKGRTYIYLLLAANDPLLSWAKEMGYRFFTFPYCFLAKGRVFPEEKDKIYIDIRDL
jgi:ribosomal protein S18 acetylase RimI-like enzyme